MTSSEELIDESTNTPAKPSRFRGYLAGIISGAAYGLNPLFALPLIQNGMQIHTILLFRYAIAAILIALFMLIRRQAFRITPCQFPWLLALGILYAFSSIFLFESYHSVPSGIATTIVYLYPVLVAIIMVCLKVYPTWQTWLSIVLTFIGVVLLCQPTPGAEYHWLGLLLAFGSAFVYALFIIIINHSKTIASVSSSLLTFYSLLVGTTIFFVQNIICGFSAIPDFTSFLMILGLAVMPTVVSTSTLAIATRSIGATQAAVLGVFEPITAILIGVLAFHESLSLSIILGLSIAIFAIVFMTVSGSKNKT